jgi:cobalt-zinc-cadmium resistance protein CzcA
MMTALVDGLGLLPAALSTRIGAQTQRPLAIVVIGGAISIALLTRVFQPTLVYVLHRQVGLIDNNDRPSDPNPHSGPPPSLPAGGRMSPANPFST